MVREQRDSLAHISQILPKVVSQDSGEQSSQQTPKDQENMTDECTCRTCGKKFQGEVIRYLRFRPVRELRPPECPTCKAAREQQEQKEREGELENLRAYIRVKWRQGCGMPAELLAKNFNNWDKRYQREAYKAAFEWAKDFNLDAPRGYRSLIFYSDNPGVGKGHLMAAVVNYIIDNWKGYPREQRCPIRFESGPSLVRRIRATYNIRREDDIHEREDEVYHSLAGVPLLLLDDVGKETPSSFTRETYWYIIDERVKSGLPMIISSRLRLEGSNSLVGLMGVDTVDRLYGMARGLLIEMVGQSYRRRNAIP